MYFSGQWPATPKGVQRKRFRATIREWVCIEDANSPEALKDKNSKKAQTLEERLDIAMCENNPSNYVIWNHYVGQ